MTPAVTLDVEARAGETASEQVAFPVGGRVRLEVAEDCSPPTPIWTRVRNAAGERLDVHLRQRLEFEEGPRIGSGFIDPRSPAFVHPPRASGRYEIQAFSSGWASSIETFEVVAGDWTTVRVGAGGGR